MKYLFLLVVVLSLFCSCAVARHDSERGGIPYYGDLNVRCYPMWNENDAANFISIYCNNSNFIFMCVKYGPHVYVKIK